MNQVRNIEYLSADMLDDDFIRIFQPIFFVHRALGLLRVQIKYKYPTSPSLLYQIYCNIFWLLNLFCVVYFVVYCEQVFDSRYANATIKIGVLLNGIYGVLLVFRNNLQGRNKTSLLYVKLQKIERYLNMRNTRSMNKMLGRQSVFAVLSASLFIILWITLYKAVLMTNMCTSLILTMLTGVGQLVEKAEIYFIIHLITTRLNYINYMLRQGTVTNKPLKKQGDYTKLFFVSNAPKKYGIQVPSETVTALYCILEALADFTELFQFSLFYFVCQILALHLVSIHYVVTSLKEQWSADFDLMLCVIPLLLHKHFVMSILCFEAEGLSTKLMELRKLCIDITSSMVDDGKSRNAAKQIIMLIEGRHSVSIYNICTLGTRLPLHVLAVTATYTIVLLQFALL